jgi:hypothetical protein
MEALVAPYWQQAWEHLEGSLGGFVYDAKRALYRAEAAWEEAKTQEERSQAIVQQYRCALVLTSVHSIASNIPISLVLALLDAGLWSPSIAYTYVTEMEHGDHGLIELIPYLPEHLLRRALSIVAQEVLLCGNWDGDWPITKITSTRTFPPLAKRFVELGYAEELMALLAKQPEQARAEVLVEVLPSLPVAMQPKAVEETLQCIETLNPGELKATLLLALVPRFSTERKNKIIEEATQIFEEHKRKYRAYPYWASLFAKAGLSQKALEYAYDMKEPQWVAAALARSIAFFGEPERTKALHDAFANVEKFFLSEPSAFSRQLHFDTLRTLYAFAPETGKVFSQKYLSKRQQASFLIHLAKKERPEAFSEACAAVEALIDIDRVFGSLELAPLLPQNDAVKAAQDALVLLKELSQRESTECELDSLQFWGGYFSNAGQSLVIQAARLLPKEERDPKLLEVLTSTRHIEDSASQVCSYSGIVELLSEQNRTKVIERAKRATQKTVGIDRGVAMAFLAPVLPIAERAKVVCEAAGILCKIQERHVAVDMLADILPLLPETERAETIDWLMSHIESEAGYFSNRRRGSTLISVVAPYLSEAQIEQIWIGLAQQEEQCALETLLSLSLTLQTEQCDQKFG